MEEVIFQRDLAKVIKVPWWLYFLCGCPKGKDLPRRVLTLPGLFLDIVAFIMLSLMLIVEFLRFDDELAWLLPMIMISYMGGALLINIIHKLSHYELELEEKGDDLKS